MNSDYRKIRVFVASPGDVQAGRRQLRKVVEELNRTIAIIAPEKKVVLELVGWETHVTPGIGQDVQSVVDQQIGEHDIFVGIMWKHMGTPTTHAPSGTAQEFANAYTTWQQDNRALQVLFYFCQEPFPPPRSSAEVEQLAAVVRFDEELGAKGLLLGDYLEHAAFADAVRPHLLQVLGRMLSPRGSPAEAAQRVTERMSHPENAAMRLHVESLAQEYEHVRATMPAGDTRTRKMELLGSQMRSLAYQAYGLLPELAGSDSAGKHLAGL